LNAIVASIVSIHRGGVNIGLVGIEPVSIIRAAVDEVFRLRQ
jgi:hypothetical protein